MKTKTEMFLTPKQKLFCDEYLTDMNATRAALRAGYSATTALNGALMRMAKIKLYLQERTAEAAERAQITQDMVLRELGKIAFANMGNYFDADGRVKPMNQLSDDDKAALWQVDADGTLTIKIKMHNKLSALDKIAKHLNFYKPEIKKPEPVYVYLDKEDMTADDVFEEEDEDGVQKQEDGCVVEPEATMPVDDAGNVLRDSAGIPYGPVTEAAQYKIDLNDTPAQLLAKLNLEPGVIEPEKPAAIVTEAGKDATGNNYGYPKIFAVVRG